LLLPLGALLLMGCTALSWIALNPSSLLAGRTFLSTQLTQAGAARLLVPGTRLSLEFSDASHFGARAGCNLFGGTYRVEGTALVISQTVTTLIACSPKLEQQEEWLFDLLRSRPSLVLAGRVLMLSHGDIVAQFQDAAVNPDGPAAVGQAAGPEHSPDVHQDHHRDGFRRDAGFPARPAATWTAKPGQM
jgi:heat shock protein HslJ